MIDGDDERDRIGELIRAAGKRSVPSEDERRRVLGAAHRAWQAKVRARRRNRWLALAASVGGVVVLAAGIAVWPERESETLAASVLRSSGAVEVQSVESGPWQALAARDATLAAGARVRSSASGRVSLDLNGISLRAGGATEFVLDSAARIDLVNGTIYVDSGSRTSGGGIEVATAFGELKDIGTQFEVRSLPERLRLRVREGRVLLSSPGLPNEIESTAGNELTVDEGGDIRRRPFPSVHADWAWAESLAVMPELNGRSAREVLAWIARETGRRLEYDDPAAELRARNAVLSGGGNVELAPLEALEVVSGTVSGLDVTLDEDVLSVRSP